ncbi:MAG: hypothetical protein NTW42_03420 [Deltaproteobacteria bacterium]|nr:hypothetical protein [Deltaproteobacteria bacterium]
MKRTLSFFPLFLLFAGIFCFACLTGCAMFGDKGGQAEEAKQDVYVHTVEWPGETLPMIAQWYTGNKDNGKILAKTNPDIAAEHLAVGDQVRIPLELVKNNKSMPKEFLSTFSAKDRAAPKKSSSKTKPAPEKKDEFQPYGPK